MIACLRRVGVEVVERHQPVWEDEHKWATGIGAAARLAVAEARLLRRPPDPYDAIIVGYPGHPDLLTARGAPVVFNPLVSLWDTFVSDRRRFSEDSLAARALRTIDRWALRAADLVVADTAANAAFLARLAGLERVEVCFVGAEERVFKPGWTVGGPVLFVGKLIPLHGIETILAAARLVPDVPIRVVGSGQLEPLLASRPANVEWLPWVDYERLPEQYWRASCALGIFGTSEKAHRVIPNKVFQALACGAPVITADTPAARELLVDGESALLVPPGDPGALAKALGRLADAGLTARIAAGGRAAYEERASEEVLGQRWRRLLESL